MSLLELPMRSLTAQPNLKDRDLDKFYDTVFSLNYFRLTSKYFLFIEFMQTPFMKISDTNKRL